MDSVLADSATLMIAETVRSNVLRALVIAEEQGFDEARAWIEGRLAVYTLSMAAKHAKEAMA